MDVNVNRLLNSEPPSSQESVPSTASSAKIPVSSTVSRPKPIRLTDAVSQQLAETITGALEIYAVVLNEKKGVKGKQDAHKNLAQLLCQANPNGHTIQHQTVKKWIASGMQLGTAEHARVNEISR